MGSSATSVFFLQVISLPSRVLASGPKPEEAHLKFSILGTFASDGRKNSRLFLNAARKGST